jgi:hypothetical protein
MKKLINLLSVFIVLALLVSCEYAKIHPVVQSPNTPVSFTTDIQPIFNKGCTCHKPGGPLPDLTVGKSYKSLMDNTMVVAGNAGSSILYQEVSTGGMSGYCDGSSADKIKNWINQGALNN